jgi:hypothetical protein
VTKPLFALALALCLQPLITPAAPPTTVKASYQIYRNNLLLANVQETFTRGGDGKYRIESTTITDGVAALLSKDRITRVSTGLVTKDGLKPQFYEEKRTSGDKIKAAATARFDWEKRKVDLVHGDKSEQVDLPAGTLDWSALFYQFLFRTPRKDLVSVTLTDGKRVETYDYKFADDGDLTTPAGKFQTAHYVRTSKESERKTEIWLAKNKSYFPVRLTQQEDGNVIEQRLVALSFN